MSDAQELSREAGLVKVGELIRGIRIAMLTTANEWGVLHSRPMATQELAEGAEWDGELWFLTRKHSGKTEEIRKDADVNLSYADAKGAKFVSIAGTAEVSYDRAKIHELWNAQYKAWFPGGEDDPEIAVLRVRATEAEYWEASSSAMARTFRVLLKAVTGGKTEVGENKKVTLAG